jgi:hypothetical protein
VRGKGRGTRDKGQGTRDEGQGTRDERVLGVGSGEMLGEEQKTLNGAISPAYRQAGPLAGAGGGL